MTAVGPGPATAAGKAPAADTKPSEYELLEAIVSKHFKLVRGEDDVAYLNPRRVRAQAFPVRSGKARSLLRRIYRDEVKSSRPPSKATIEAVIETLVDLAEDERQSKVSRRVARTGDRIALDLADAEGRVVVIRPGRWTITTKSPEMFLRGSATGCLPQPSRAGDVERLREFVHVPDRYWPLVLCVLLSWFFPRQPSPMLQLIGGAGAAKSTTTEVLKGLLDPFNARAMSPISKPPSKEEEFTIGCHHQHVVAYNNVSLIPLWWSDALCRYITGDAHIGRAKFTDFDLAASVMQGPVLMNGITMGVLRPDLMERTIPVPLARIAKSERKYASDLSEGWETARPIVLGGLLDLLSDVLQELPRVELADPPRMADFARLCAAYDRATGGNVLHTYMRAVEAMPGQIVQEDAVAHAIHTLATQRRHWWGTTEQLMAALPKDGAWPKEANKFSERLHRVIDVLADVGVVVTERKSNSLRIKEISYEPPTSHVGPVRVDRVDPVPVQPCSRIRQPRRMNASRLLLPKTGKNA